MTVTQGVRVEIQPFVPYIYRGIGVDQLDPMGTGVVYGAEPKPKRKPRREPKVWVKPTRKRREPQPRRHGRWAAVEQPEPEWWTELPTIAPPPVAPAPPPPVHKPRAAPGWNPLTGADLDDLLGES